jgi:protein-S-isoprenylcysteine O-methyltransferase Ste14
MRASAIEFRLRMLINAVIILLGFWAPWIEGWHMGRRMPLVEWLALELGRTGIASFGAATKMVLTVAVLIAAKGVLFRVWGSAFLGAGTVNSAHMIAGTVMADGPYRYLRNPLYIGLCCMVIAMSFLMPVTGAVFAVVLILIFAVRLTLGEENFLSGRMGDPYLAYMRAVPRFIPRLRGAPAAGNAKPQWLRAALTELTPIGVLAGLVIFWRNYDLQLAGRIILIFFGASLVVRAVMPGVLVKPEPAG